MTMFGNLKYWLYIGPTMKTLIIHPQDKSTEFLAPIYANLRSKTVVRCGITKSGLHRLIETHDRVMMLGHGAPYGLMNPRQFPDAGLFIIDGSMTDSLKNKPNNIYIWCHADQFVKRYGLSGLCSGMFISEVGETSLYGYTGVDIGLIEQSNERFAGIMSKWISEPLDLLYYRLIDEYSKLARTNPIAKFNLERLYLCGSEVLCRAN